MFLISSIRVIETILPPFAVYQKFVIYICMLITVDELDFQEQAHVLDTEASNNKNQFRNP